MNGALDSFGIRKIAAPLPSFRSAHQSTRHRIAVDIAQLFDALAVGEYIEIVITSLPECFAHVPMGAAGDGLSHGLNDGGKEATFGFAD